MTDIMSRISIMRKFLVTWAILALAPFFLGLESRPAFGQAFENLDRIDSLVATTTGANIGEPGGAIAPVDRRLKLAACPGIPSVEGPVFGAAIVRCDALGWRIRVPLGGGGASAGAPGQPGSVRGAPVQRTILVKKGDPVQLIAGNDTFSVSKAMVADEDGAAGDTIRVREDKNGPAVTGRVEATGIVRIPGI
jgi:flagella basal body P-ring formation protein FlgA